MLKECPKLAVIHNMSIVKKSNSCTTDDTHNFNCYLQTELNYLHLFKIDLIFRWFKFTLKPPYRIPIDKLRLAIWDTFLRIFLFNFGFWIFQYITTGLFAGPLSADCPDIKKFLNFCSDEYFEL